MKRNLFIFVIIIFVSLFFIFKVSSQSKSIITLVADDSGLGGSWYWVDTPTPRVITTTPRASQTPWVVTATSDVEITPTQEMTLPPIQPTSTATPSPTVIPPTQEPECSVKNTSEFTVYVRTSPEIRSSNYVLDQNQRKEFVNLQQYIRPEAYYQDSARKWYKHWWNESLYVWSAEEFFTTIIGCDDLEYENPLPDSTREIMQGAHVISADAANLLLHYCTELDTVKLFENVIHYADDFRACNPEIWIVCRYWTDDIAVATDYDAQEAYRRIGDKFPDACDAVEWENEKAPTNHRDLERWSSFSIEAATLMAQNRNMQYCAFGLGPGWPDFDKLQYLVEYIKWADENPLPDGRYHCISSHAAMYAPWERSDMPWVNDSYLAGRVYLIRDWIYENTGFDLYEWNGVWDISEVGLSDGYSGNWDALYTCEELAQAYWTTHNTYKEHEFPHVQQHWNFGLGGILTDDSACAEAIWK